MTPTRTSSRSPIGFELLLLAAACGGAPTRAAPSVEPELVAPGVLSTDAIELNAAFTPDGKMIYFTVANDDFTQNTIYESHLVDGQWTPRQVAPFSSVGGNDGDPFVTADGAQLFFMSKRPVTPGGAPRSDWDLWVMPRAGDGWGAPRHLGPTVNSDTDDYYPVTTRDGTLYFASERAGGLGQHDLYRSRLVGGEYQPPENLGPNVNSPESEHDAWVNADETLMLFIVRNPPGGLGGADFFVSRRGAGGWEPRRLLKAPLNSKSWDFCPWVTPDGKWLYFTSSRRGSGDLYRMPLEQALRD